MNEEIYKKYYKQLIGYKVTEVIVEKDDVFGGDVPFVAFIMQKGKDKLLVTLFSDEEGNGTGHLNIDAYDEEN